MVLASCVLMGCSEQPPTKAYVTEYGLGPDKWATAWLLTTKVSPGARLDVVQSSDASNYDGTRFDSPTSDIRRNGNQAAFEVAKSAFRLDDPALSRLGKIVNEIEINYWSGSQLPDAVAVEEAFRGLQFRYGRDAVTPGCYVDFFNRVYDVLKQQGANTQPVSKDQLNLDCGELRSVAQRQHSLVPEVPLIDVLTAVSAGKKVVFVDVREPDEFAEGHIPDALNIQLRHVTPEIKKQFEGAQYVVSYCIKDFRGFEMAKALAEVGVQNSVIMRPYGIKGWVARGLPVTGSRALTEAHARERLDGCMRNLQTCMDQGA